MFGFGKDWNAKQEKGMKSQHPYLDTLYPGVALTKLRVDDLRKKLGISTVGQKNREVNAFYLGAIEGDIRQALDISNVSMSQLAQLVQVAAIYAAIKEKDITNDGQFGALLKDYQEVFCNDYDWYRKRGLGYTGVFNEDPETNWNMFAEKIAE